MSVSKLIIDPQASPLPFAAAIAAEIAGEQVVSVEYKVSQASPAVLEGSAACVGSLKVAKVISQLSPASLADDEKWTAFAESASTGKIDFNTMLKFAAELDAHLRLNTLLGGNQITVGDVACWAFLRSIPAWNKTIKDGGAKGLGPEVVRWFNFVNGQEAVSKAIAKMQDAAQRLKEKKKDQASYDIDLVGAEYGKVVTRFPPEPSGYLHIGHAKAAMLNQYFAQHYGGKLLIRFDDTNPSKEKSEYEQSILEDLEMLGIKGDSLTYTSDYFDQLAEYCRQMIRTGHAYADDTTKEVMNEQRFHGIASKNRDLAPEESLLIFEEMTKGSEEGLKFCIRAKLSVDNPNKAMRDPVIFRCNLTPHHRTGEKHKAYPTYDFACPIIDSIEGVTHALRTNEYRDRNDQYYWMIDALGIRKPFIWDYSRMNFVYTLLSKRKLNWFVNNGVVSGWDDPRFPTVRGILRRGLTAAALREYILMQGPSRNVLLLEWDKLWTINKKYIDPISPRFVALSKDNLCRVVINGGPAEPYTSSISKHKKNPDLGSKDTSYSSLIYLEQQDASTLSVGDEVTLMDWGNVIVESVEKEEGIVLSVTVKLHLEGDFKKTEKKFTWLSPDPATLINVELYDYDYLITKKKLDEDDPFEDFVTPVSEFVVPAVGDANMATLKKGEFVQLERKGFFIVDQPLSGSQPLKLIAVPDGRAKSTSSKCDPTTTSKAVKYVYRRIRGQPLQDEQEVLSAGKAVAAAEYKPMEPKIVKQFFDSVGSAPGSGKMDACNANARELLLQLMKEAEPADLDLKQAPSQTLAARVDGLLTTFREKNGLILPRTNLLNEALQIYVNAGNFDKVQSLVSEMTSAFGVQPNNQTAELVALAYSRSGKTLVALQMLGALPKVSQVGQEVYERILVDLFRHNKDEQAWKVFDELRSKCLPTPSLSALMISRCGKLENVEQAFRLHRELSAQGMTANGPILASLIYAASKRKEYFPTAIDLFRQMELLNIPIHRSVYNHMLYACAKVSDIATAMSFWKTLCSTADPAMEPNEHSCANYLWALASIEPAHHKLSKKSFTYTKITSRDISNAAEEVIQFMKEKGLSINKHCVSSLLAVYSNNRLTDLAERLFWGEKSLRAQARTPFAFELMFKLYDNISDYEGAKKVYHELQNHMVKIPLEGWRALARTAALTNHLEDAIRHVEEMVAQGYKPTLNDLKHVNLRFVERERQDLVQRLKQLCERDHPYSPNPFIPWLQRSRAVGSLLEDVYGKDAPKACSRMVSSQRK